MRVAVRGTGCRLLIERCDGVSRCDELGVWTTDCRGEEVREHSE